MLFCAVGSHYDTSGHYDILAFVMIQAYVIGRVFSILKKIYELQPFLNEREKNSVYNKTELEIIEASKSEMNYNNGGKDSDE